MNRDDSKVDEYIVQEHSEQMRPLSESFVAKFFSVQSVLVSLCLFGIICSGVAASAVSEVSCDEALGDTRDGSTLASKTCFTTAASSLEVTVFRLLGFSAQGVEGQVAAYLGDIKQEMRKLEIHVDTARAANVSMGLPYILSTLELQYQIMKASIDPAVTDKALQSQIRGSGVFGGNHFASLQWYWILQKFYTFRTRDDRPDQNPGQLSYHPGIDLSATLIQWELESIASLEAARVSRNGYLADGDVKWSNPTLLGQFLGYQIVQRHSYPNEPNVETNFFLSLENINNFFRLAGIRLQAAGANTSHPRVFGVIASTWLNTATKVRPNEVLLDPTGKPALPDRKDLNNHLVGVSHGVGTHQIEGGAWSGAMPLHQSQLRDINATDSIIAGISLAIHDKGGYDVVKKAPHGFARLTISRNVNLTEIQYVANLDARGYVMLTEDHYAGVRRFDDGHGIDWWIVHSLDVESIMKEVEEERKSSQHTIRENNNKIADKIDDDRRNTKLIVAGVAFAIVLICIFVVNSVISPIKRVQNAMSRVALMDLESKHSQVLASSKLFEVRQMQKDFIAMVKSLKEFRAYVPSSLFEGESEEGSTVHAPSGNVAVFFSDIQSSTALWRRNAADMNIAIELHNDVFRKHYREHEAYEVKTIGDAFMCVFQSPEMAMKYALRVQRELVKQKWPESLELGKGGLVVRMGVNYGDVILEKNPVTGRSDYRGSTVNMASRLEGKAFGGTVCVSSDFIAMLKSNGHWSSCGIAGSKRIGMEDLKGLGSHELHIIAPETLEGRLDPKTTDCVAPSKKEDRKQSQLSAQQQHLNPESDRASESHVSSAGGMGDGGRKARKTGLQLSKNSDKATESSVLFDNCNIMVRTACEAAQATDGVVASLAGRTMVILWNASKRCNMHSTAGLNFAARLQYNEDSMHVGVSTGVMVHGNVGTNRNRFASAFGTPLDAAEAVADFSFTFETFALYADCTRDERWKLADELLKPCLRLVDIWHEASSGLIIKIHEIACEEINSRMNSFGLNAGAEGDSQNVAFSAAVESFYQGKNVKQCMDLVQGIANGGTDRPATTCLKLMLQANTPEQGARTKIVFNRIPYGAQTDEQAKLQMCTSYRSSKNNTASPGYGQDGQDMHVISVPSHPLMPDE